jgi:hypothetical protein
LKIQVKRIRVAAVSLTETKIQNNFTTVFLVRIYLQDFSLGKLDADISTQAHIQNLRLAIDRASDTGV